MKTYHIQLRQSWSDMNSPIFVSYLDRNPSFVSHCEASLTAGIDIVVVIIIIIVLPVRCRVVVVVGYDDFSWDFNIWKYPIASYSMYSNDQGKSLNFC